MADTTPNEAASAARADWIRALTEERDGYLAIGLTDRAKLVDAQIAAFAPEQAEAPKRSTRQR